VDYLLFSGEEEAVGGVGPAKLGTLGACQLAYKQAALWARFENQAEERFKGFLGSDKHDAK
jgi:hypothetical protein